MNKKLSLDEIRSYWTRQAVEHGKSCSASWSDFRVIQMEIREMLNYLKDGDRVLDVGCGNGFSAVQLASQRRIDVKGVDCIPEMIKEARGRVEALDLNLPGSIEFTVGDILSLDEPDGAWDKVIVVRVIINLHGWENQLKAVQECVRVLKPGGLLLMSEATMEGWSAMNHLRAEHGLPEIPVPAFNAYLSQNQVVGALADDAELLDLKDFSSTYYVGTRVLKPLFAQMTGAPIDVADPGSDWNRWFSQMPSWGGYGVQRLFVFQKK